MNCREFDERWDDLFDARREGTAHLERRLEEHASACPRCRTASDRNQMLRQAIGGLRAPRPSPGSIDRLLTLAVPSARPAIAIEPPRPPRRRWKPMATAAAFALAWLGVNCWPDREPAVPIPPGRSPSIAPRRPLGLTLAAVSEATLDLARKTSAPASRFGREVFKLGGSRKPTGDAPAVIEVDDEAADSAAEGLIRAVGDKVRPISGSARHAFSFLLGPADDATPTPTPGRSDSL